MTPLERITQRISRNGDINLAATRRPLLSLEEFFDGNNVVGSIWCNCSPQLSPAQAFEVLQRIRTRPDVADVRIEVTMFDDPEWPFSEMVWVITSASAAEVQSWFPESVAPDEVWIGWRDGVSYESLAVPADMHPVACWWD